eukprot:TRINITY_DN25991_c0_g1_i2.p1 TRINITY_DN25991_c0_g1~~TRINITY_DN25991_c0_g1_i2.p1  ORF type:complete len:223 (-),score=34.74 TRINITY_DN25991_c0_g1_i2:95-763(-)
MNFNLKDVTGNRVSAKIFCSCFLDLDDEVNYILGVCENSCAENPQSHNPGFNNTCIDKPLKTDVCSSSSDGDADSISPLKVDVVNVSIDTDNLLICSCSGAFEDAMRMKAHGLPFIDLLSEKKEFLLWVQGSVNEMIYREEQSELTFGKVHIRSPALEKQGLALRARCSMLSVRLARDIHADTPSAEEHAFDEDVTWVTFSLRHVKVVRAKKFWRHRSSCSL